jgi:hypothetical protein
MTERILEISPFATKFMEPIKEDDILDATGHYNEATQTWILENGSSDSSALMSGLNPERPPTTCQRMTKVGDKHWTTDTYVDD